MATKHNTLLAPRGQKTTLINFLTRRPVTGLVAPVPLTPAAPDKPGSAQRIDALLERIKARLLKVTR